MTVNEVGSQSFIIGTDVPGSGVDEEVNAALATPHVLGVTSLWLLLPVYVGVVQTALLTADWFGWLRLLIIVANMVASVVYWGYFNDEGSIALHVDVNLARLTVSTHFVYALIRSRTYALVGVVGTALITSLYTASYRASIRRSPGLVKLTYHLLFRYVGFWEVYILHSNTSIAPAWWVVFVVTSAVYFGHAYAVFWTFSSAIGYESRLAAMGLLVIGTGIFTHFWTMPQQQGHGGVI